MLIYLLHVIAFLLFGTIVVQPFNVDRDFLKAAETGDASLLKDLLTREGSKRPSITTRNNYGVSAILFAANNGHLDCVKVLLDYGAYINDRSNNGKTPVLWAALWGHYEVVDYLIERKANLNITDKEELTVVMSAVLSGNARLLRRVLQENVNVTAINVYNGTALSIARAKGRDEMVRLLTPYFDPPPIESPYIQFLLTSAYMSKLGIYEIYKGFTYVTKGWERWNDAPSFSMPPQSSTEAAPSVGSEL
eukprot:gene27439-33142_t